MRKSRLSASEIEAAELAENNRRQVRNGGLSLMSIRDRGWARLDSDMTMLWHSDRDLTDGETRRNVPPGHFIIKTNKEELLFEADEFQRYLRWC